MTLQALRVTPIMSSDDDRVAIYTLIVSWFIISDLTRRRWRSPVKYFIHPTAQQSVDSAVDPKGDPLPPTLLRNLQERFPTKEISYAYLHEVINSVDTTRQVQDRGGFITLGIIHEDSTEAEVQAAIYYANLSGKGVTFFLSKHASRWRILKSSVTFVA